VQVKYIGSEVARGLWGIKYTRRPVDIMVGVAKNLPPNKVLPNCELKVSTDGVQLEIKISHFLSARKPFTLNCKLTY